MVIMKDGTPCCCDGNVEGPVINYEFSGISMRAFLKASVFQEVGNSKKAHLENSVKTLNNKSSLKISRRKLLIKNTA